MIVENLRIIPRHFKPVEPDNRGSELSQGEASESVPVDDIEALFGEKTPVCVSSLLYNLRRMTNEPDSSLLDTLSIIYDAVATEVDDNKRQRLFQSVVTQVRETKLDPAVILVFVTNESNHFIVREAVCAYLEIKRVGLADPFSATREITSLITAEKVSNKGAAYAGLISFGDRRVCSIARTIRSTLSTAEIRAFAATASNPLHGASIEFCLTWLVDLVNQKDLGAAIALASALSSMINKDPGLIVHNVEQNFGPYGFSSTTVSPDTDYKDLLIEAAPLLEVISAADQPVLNRTIEIIRDPLSRSLDQLERRLESGRRKRSEQRASDRRIVNIQPHLDRRSLERRAEQRRLEKRR